MYACTGTCLGTCLGKCPQFLETDAMQVEVTTMLGSNMYTAAKLALLANLRPAEHPRQVL